MTHPRRHPGFTLLELVLVLMLIGTAMAMAAPSLRGWGRASRLRDAGDQLLAVARYARVQAIANSQVYRLYVDPAAGTYHLLAQDGQQFVPLANDFGRVFALPDHYRIAMADDRQQAMEFVEFFPTGRTQPASIRITAEDGDAYDLVCPSPAEGFMAPGAQQEPPR